MPAPAPDRAALLSLLPEDRVGVVERLEPITLGLSGAGVYAVTTSRGACVLRVQKRDMDEGSFAQQLRVLRRAADAGVAPAVLHVNEEARAVVSARVPGVSIAGALADPELRAPVLASVVNRLRTLHALDPSGVDERDPVAYARASWVAARDRPGFPPWAASLAPTLDATADALARDPRRVVSHNDLNPVNVLWDGARAWLVDWEFAALGHPYFDLAVLAMFRRLEDGVALALGARHDGATLDEGARATFRALRRLAALLSGLTFLSLVDDLSVLPAPTRADAPSLGACYEALRAGELDLRGGQAGGWLSRSSSGRRRRRSRPDPPTRGSSSGIGWQDFAKKRLWRVARVNGACARGKAR